MNKVLKKVLLVVNPMANKHKAAWQTKLIQALALRKWPYQLYQTSSCLIQNQAFFSDNLAQFSDVIVLGGDGTLHIVANCLAYTDVPMSFIPCGTGNDFARSWYGDLSDKQLLECVLDGQVNSISLGKVNQRYFINVAGIGFDGAVLQASQGRKSYFPKLSYLLQTLEHLWGYQGQVLEVSALNTCWVEAKDGHKSNGELVHQPDCEPEPELPALIESCQRPSFMLAIANGQYFGGGMMIAPHANLAAPRLAYCHIQDCRWSDKLINLLRIFSGAHLNAPIVAAGQIHNGFKILTSGIPMEADGEWLGLSPAEITVCPNALKLRGIKT
jgi:diacylglycerol kinase (ATP)